MSRSLNKVELIGNLTRDPEMRYTPAGAAVCTFGLATNRQWTTDTGDKKEDVEFHRIVAWNKLAELCSQLLTKGRKIYVEGRLQTRKWMGQDQIERSTTEIVINDMIILDSRFSGAGSQDDYNVPEDLDEPVPADDVGGKKTGDKAGSKQTTTKSSKTSASDNKKSKEAMDAKDEKSSGSDAEEDDEDIPF